MMANLYSAALTTGISTEKKMIMTMIVTINLASK